MYGCTGVQVPPLSYILFPCSGLCWHALPFSLLLETIGTTWNLYDPRILLDVPCPPVPEMYGCTDVQVPPFIHDKQKNRSWCWGVGSWGRRILRTMGWWGKVNLCSTLWVRLLKASDTIRLWNSMSEKKQRVERVIRNGQGWIRSTHFNHLQPKAQPKKTSFRYRTILKKC